MKKTTTKFDKISVGICIALLIFLAFSITARFLSRQILIETLHWDNRLTRAIWFDNSVVGAFGNNDVYTEESSKTIDIDWETMYPFYANMDSTNINKNRPLDFLIKTAKNAKQSVQTIEDKISDYSEELLIGYDFEVGLAKKYNAFLGVDSIPNLSGGSSILSLDNGYLTNLEPLVNTEGIDTIADSVEDFSTYLNNQGIPFCYVNTGSKVCPYDKQTSFVDFEFTNENGDALLKALSERNVAFLDMREEMIKDHMDWYGSYYITDHHWKTETGLWAAKQLASYLNNYYNYAFNIEKFSPSNYNMETTEKFWLGGQGRKLALTNASLDSYTKITPKYETNFHIEIPTRNISRDGSYEEVLFDNKKYNAVLSYSKSGHGNKVDAYHLATWRNDALGVIRNNNRTSNCGKKILFLQDSFCWYSTTFLACDVESIDIIHPAEFTGSIRRYIDETKPDIVIMMICEENINPPEEAEHREIFELK